MAFRIHEDQENTALALRKDAADIFSANQRRALGDLSQFACNQNRNSKLPGLTNVTCKVQDENRTMRQINNEKNIVPPVAQFRAFSVYEDSSTEVEVKKREPTFKHFVAREARKDSLFTNASENVKVPCAKADKEPVRQKEVLPLRQPLQEKKDVVESPMSVGDSSVLSMSISKNESQLIDDDEDTTTAQTDREMFFHVVEYRQDIYEYMREIEVKNRASPRYMRKQPDITHVMRSILVDWLVEVCDEYNQQSETLHLAVSYVDRFLSYMSVVRTKLQLVGTAATYIASLLKIQAPSFIHNEVIGGRKWAEVLRGKMVRPCPFDARLGGALPCPQIHFDFHQDWFTHLVAKRKYEEVYPPEVTEFVYITDDTYTKREVLRMEHLILKVLSFDLSTPTSLAFLSHYCISNGLSKKTFHLAAYIAELCLLEADPYLQYKPSVIAAGALATTRHCLLCERCANNRPLAAEGDREDLSEVHPHCVAVAWPQALADCSGYTFAELKPVLRELARTHSHVPLQPHQAIPDKYKNNKFDGVSSIEARPMFPVPSYQPPAPQPPAARPAPQPPASRPAPETTRSC